MPIMKQSGYIQAAFDTIVWAAPRGIWGVTNVSLLAWAAITLGMIGLPFTAFQKLYPAAAGVTTAERDHHGTGGRKAYLPAD